MTINVPALIKLFPERRDALHSADERASTTLRGPCPYDAIMSVGEPFSFATDFVAAVEAVRADGRLGPVYAGDLSLFGGDHSRADLAVAGAFARLGLGAPAIDTAMRTSGLYRDKWERDDYRRNTINKALESARDRDGEPQDGSPQTNTVGSIASGEPAMLSYKLLDPASGKVTISTGEPSPRDYVLEGLLLPGKSAVLAGFGGVSKTQLALQLATSIALGVRFMGRTVKAGKVIAILGEEDQGEIARRLSAIARRQRLSEGQIQRLEADMRAYPLVGRDVRLTAPGKDGLAEREFAREIIATARSMGDVRLIVVDHLALVHGGDHNAREDAALTMRVLNHIAQQTSAPVLLLAHTPKGASDKEESDASMVAGSTAFVDQARGAWVLATMRVKEAKNLAIEETDRKDYVSLSIVKNNYGPTGEVIWFKRVAFDGIGLLEHVVLSPPAIGAKAAANLDAKIIAIITAHPGQYSKTRFRDTHSGTKGPLKASKGLVEGAIEDLLSTGQLRNRPPSDYERNTFGLSPRVKHVLDLGLVK